MPVRHTLLSTTEERTIGTLAQVLGLTTRTLRYWEAQGLIPPAERTPGRSRRYGLPHEQAARGVVRFKHIGLSLDEIRDLQGEMAAGPTALAGMAATDALLARRQEELRSLIQQAQNLLAELESARRCVQLCDGCHGKAFDSGCVSCLQTASGDVVPDTLHCLMTAAERIARNPARVPAPKDRHDDR